MKKIILPLFALSLVFSCSRRYECNCNYKQRSFEVNSTGDTVEVRRDTTYLSYINFTSKKLAKEECNVRGTSLMMDSLKIEAACSVSKYKP